MKKISIVLFFVMALLSCSPERNNSSVIDKQESDTNDTVIIKNYGHGQKLFQDNCAPCHGENEFVVAYPFQNIRKDYDLPWILSFIRNSDSLIKAGDVRATFVFELHNQSVMSKFNKLTDQQIIDILDYVDTFPIINSYNNHRKLSIASMVDSIKKWEDVHEEWEKETIRNLENFRK